MEKVSSGRRGEEFAADYYRKLGYEIIEMNYHSRYGEIDVIAENETHIVFCEVKTRRLGTGTKPCEAVDLKKQQKLTLTAFKYLEGVEGEKLLRFDVFEVWVRDDRIVKFNNIENAFEPVDISGRYDIF